MNAPGVGAAVALKSDPTAGKGVVVKAIGAFRMVKWTEDGQHAIKKLHTDLL